LGQRRGVARLVSDVPRTLHCMARYVIDARTLLHIVSADVKVRSEHQLVAPNVLRSQALSLLYDQVRRDLLTEAEALQLHERLTEVKVRLLGDRVSRRTAWRIAREQGWDALDDAEYLAVTRLQADALVTIDDSLARIAAGIVPVAQLDALVRA
jgi:predicted nucleic acid-binding protein